MTLPATLHSVVDCDDGAEFKGAFAARMDEHHIQEVLKDPRQRNALAVVDSAIRNLKVAIARALIETGSDDWAAELPHAVGALNRLPKDSLLGATPAEADNPEDHPQLRFELEAKAGRDLLHNQEVAEARQKKLSAAGSFRVLKDIEFSTGRAGRPTWGGEVFPVKDALPQYVTSTASRLREATRFALPVPQGSKSVIPPLAVRAGQPGKEQTQREFLEPFTAKLTVRLGDQAVSLQQAGTLLGEIRGAKAALGKAKLTNAGFRVLARLFPDKLRVVGQGQFGTTIEARGNGRYRLHGKQHVEP